MTNFFFVLFLFLSLSCVHVISITDSTDATNAIQFRDQLFIANPSHPQMQSWSAPFQCTATSAPFSYYGAGLFFSNWWYGSMTATNAGMGVICDSNGFVSWMYVSFLCC